MKVILLIILFSFNAQAYDMSQGNAEYGGTVGFGYSSEYGSILQLSPKYQYFVIDKLSVGGTIDYYKDNLRKEFGYGPSATYYILDEGQFIPFVRQTILNYTFSGDIIRGEDGWYGTSEVGFNYFTSEHFAVGISAMSFYSLAGKKFTKETSHVLISFNFFP